MKAKALCVPVLVCVLMVWAGATAQGTDEIESLNLNVLGSWSTVNQHPDHEVPFWTEIIPEASNGQITAEITAFDLVGVGSAEVYEVVGLGLYDVGATVVGYMAGEDARLEGLDLPAVATDLALARQASDAYKPIQDEVLGNIFGVKLMASVPYSAQIVYCNTEISGLQDLAGKRIRGSGIMALRFIEAIGATSVNLAFSEVPVALERGVVDCAITGALSGYDNRWYEVSTHLYPLPAGGWNHVGTVIRLDLWNNLNSATQVFLEDQLERYEDLVWSAVGEETEEGIACNTGGECSHGPNGGMTLVPITPEDEALARRLMLEQVLPSWAERCGVECVVRWNETVGEVFGLTVNQ